MAAAATSVALVTPNVAIGSSVRRCPASAVRVAYPGMRLTLHSSASRASRVQSEFHLHARKNAHLRPFKLVVSASLDDAASSSVGTKVGDSASAGVENASLKANSEEPEGGIPSNAEATTKELEEQTEKSKAMLDEVVHNLKDVAKLQDSTKQAYSESAEKAIGVLRDTTEQLKEQAEKARAVLLATAQETAEKGKENLTLLAENSPDPLLKDIAETALNAHFPEKQSHQGARIHDFCLGIPYGSILLGGGLLWFLLTGSTAALRFGVFLGAAVLFLSITSLKVWKRGESSMNYIKGQAAIASLLLVRELRRFIEVKAFFPHAVMALLSAAMLGFYAYVYISGGNPPKKVQHASSA